MITSIYYTTVDPIRWNITLILDSLAAIFDSGSGCSVIGTHRSYILTFHELINRISVGKHSRVCALMSGVFNQRPLLPTYSFIWDVDTVLRFIKSLSVGDSISHKILTLKLMALFALAAAFRVSEITNLDINFLDKHPTCNSLLFPKVSMSWTKEQSAPVIKFLVLVYDLDKSLCICRTIDQYLNRPEFRRNNRGQLLLGQI